MNKTAQHLYNKSNIFTGYYSINVMGISCLTYIILHILQNPMLLVVVKSKENIDVFQSAITVYSLLESRTTSPVQITLK